MSLILAVELKNYQRQVLRDLSSYLSLLDKTKNIKEAYKIHWNNKNVRVGFSNTSESLPPYNDTINGTPHICFKVPTGGGKTFIACSSLKLFFDKMPVLKPKVVVWLVPSNAILDQTYNALNDVNHPYRQRIDLDFCGKVQVLSKEQLLNGQGFNPSSVRETLTICVLTYDSLRSNKKDGRKVYQQNSQLLDFIPFYETPETLVKGIDNTALIQVLNQLSPVIIVDESHNAESELSTEMLNNLNPSFVLDLTATPKEKSNIISIISANQLKKEKMVKLPIIVYKRYSLKDVVLNAIKLRNALEIMAKDNENSSGYSIRPIVLFQAQSKSKEDNETYEKLKDRLINIGIPENQIAIKTAQINEIKGKNLLSKDCEIRYIITIDALKEGWDCPFAYILASLANKTSKVEIEQIVGRVLRLPYTTEHKYTELNLSYVLTCSNDFRETLNSIVNGLKIAGFTKKDCRVADDNIDNDLKNDVSNPIQTQLSTPNDVTDEFDTITNTEFEEIKQDLQHEPKTVDPEISKMLENGKTINNEYEEELKKSDELGSVFGSEMSKYMNKCKISKQFKDIDYFIPQFVHKEISNLFGTKNILLTKDYLKEDFTLDDKDAQINFKQSNDVYKVDIEDKKEGIPKYQKASLKESKYFKKYLDSLQDNQTRKNACKRLILNQLNKINNIDGKSLERYVNRIFQNMSNDKLTLLETSWQNYASLIKDKIKKLQLGFCKEQFRVLLDTGDITCEEYYKIPKYISPTNSIDSIPCSLFEAEESMNDFEHKVITEVASLNNILWWHRIIEKKDFCINGFINHYPDFMVMTKKDNLILIETKGDYLDNSDSKQKLELGRMWQSHAGSKYKYFMVFENKNMKLDGSYFLNEFIDIINKL